MRRGKDGKSSRGRAGSAVKEGHGEASPGMARQGKAVKARRGSQGTVGMVRQGEATLGKARQRSLGESLLGEARLGVARRGSHGKARLALECRDKARQSLRGEDCEARHGLAWHGNAVTEPLTIKGDQNV